MADEATQELTETASAPPPVAATAAPHEPDDEAAETGAEEEELSLVDAFEDMLEDIEQKQAHLGTPAFNNALNSKVTVTVRNELQNNVYEILKEIIVLVGRGLADRFEELEEDFDELKTMTFEQRRAIKDIVTNNVLGAAAMLAKLTMERSTDVESRQVATAILAAIGPILTGAQGTNGEAPPAPVSPVTAAPQTAAPPKTP